MDINLKENDDLEPISLAQYKRAKDGKMILVDSDVGNIVQQIKAVNKDLCVRHSDLGKFFVVFYRNPLNGKERLVTTAKDLDGRLLNRIKKLNSGEYNYLAELAKLDAQADAAKEERLKEQMGEAAERLAHAIRKDLGVWKDSSRSKKSWGKGLVGY
jgi:hypothetical protein